MKATQRLLNWLKKMGAHLTPGDGPTMTVNMPRAMGKSCRPPYELIDEGLQKWLPKAGDGLIRPVTQQTVTGRIRKWEPERNDWPRFPKVALAKEVLPDGTRTGAFLDLNEGAKGAAIDVDEVKDSLRLE